MRGERGILEEARVEVGGEMEEIGTERRRGQVACGQRVRGRAVGDERALATRSHHDADPAGPLRGDTGRADANAVGRDRGRQRASLRIATDGADERRARPQPREPRAGIIHDRAQLREWRGRGARDNLPARIIRAAVTRTPNEVLLGIPAERAPLVCAYGKERLDRAVDVQDDRRVIAT